MSRSQTPPVWLQAPSRYAGIGQRAARITWFALAMLLLASIVGVSTHAPSARDKQIDAIQVAEQRDLILYSDIIAAVRHGEDYYQAATRNLRNGDYPLRPFISYRLPTLAIVLANLPYLAVALLLDALVALAFGAWWLRLWNLLRSTPARIVSLFMLAAGFLVFTTSGLAPFHEIWAGLLIAASLALRKPGRWEIAVATGLAAALIRETAGLYLFLMMVLAWRDGDRREAIAWLLSGVGLACTLGAHAFAVSKFATVTDPVSAGWLGMQGLGFLIQSIWVSTAVVIGPLLIASPIIALSFFGWTAVRDPLIARAGVTIGSYALLIALFARVDTFYWVLLIAPIFFVGLVFVPDALRDLWHSARVDKPRIKVTRVSQ